MLPEPKKVARLIKKAFRSAEERRKEAEFDRDVQVRMGKTRLKRHIAKQKQMSLQLRRLAKRALEINDQARFRQAGRQLLWTQRDLRRWEKYLLSLELLEARRDQVKTSVELIQSIKAMSESLNELAEPGQIGELQRELEVGLARASNLEERMAVMLDVMDSTLSADMLIEEEGLTALEEGLSEEVAGEEAAAFDREIEEGLRQIRKELEEDDY